MEAGCALELLALTVGLLGVDAGAADLLGGLALELDVLGVGRQDGADGKVIAEGNAVLPPDAQTINLEGKPAEKVGGARIDAEKAGKKK